MSQYPGQCWSLVTFNVKHSANVLHKMYVGSANYEFGKCECRLRGEDACRAYWVTALYCLCSLVLPYFFLLLIFRGRHRPASIFHSSPDLICLCLRTERKGKGREKIRTISRSCSTKPDGLDLPICPRWLSLQACGAF